MASKLSNFVTLYPLRKVFEVPVMIANFVQGKMHLYFTDIPLTVAYDTELFS